MTKKGCKKIKLFLWLFINYEMQRGDEGVYLDVTIKV
jgi:hypothetical protein